MSVDKISEVNSVMLIYLYIVVCVYHISIIYKLITAKSLTTIVTDNFNNLPIVITIMLYLLGLR